MLNDEIDRHGIEAIPSFVEWKLDEFEQPELEAKLNSWTFKATALVDFGRTMVDSLRDVRTGGRARQIPAWLEPPDRAGYPMRSASKHMTAVLPDKMDRPWLDRVVESVPMSFRTGVEPSRGMVRVDVWLEFDGEPAGDDPVLGVHLGDHRIGEIGRKDVAAYRVVMAHAAERDELPWTSARLCFRFLNESGYVLEVPLPAVD